MLLLTSQPLYSIFFFFNDTATTEIYTLSLHDALPISCGAAASDDRNSPGYRRILTAGQIAVKSRSEEHTSELQSPCNLVCRLLLEKKKNNKHHTVLIQRRQSPIDAREQCRRQ